MSAPEPATDLVPEGVPASVEFLGESFHIAGAPSEFALMEFADAAADGEDGDTMQGMASILRLLKECVAPDDWARFKQHARKSKATAVQLMPVIEATFAQAAERPTGRPADSTVGPSPTPVKSAPSAAAMASELWPGRPDLQLMAVQEAAS